jgi:hypothetical protein
MIIFEFKDQFYDMANTTESERCTQYVMENLTQIKKQLEQCTLELNRQSWDCPSSLILETVDLRLKEFVRLQRKSLFNKMNYQLTLFTDAVQEKELLQTVSTHPLLTGFVEVSE